MADLASLKPGECVRLTRANPEAAPFEPAGTAGPAAVEALADRVVAAAVPAVVVPAGSPGAGDRAVAVDRRLAALWALEGLQPVPTALLQALAADAAPARAGRRWRRGGPPGWCSRAGGERRDCLVRWRRRGGM